MTLNEMVEHWVRILQDEQLETFTVDEAVATFDHVHRSLLAEAGGLEETLTLEYDTSTQDADGNALAGFRNFAHYLFPDRFLELKHTGLRMTAPTTRILRPYQLAQLEQNWEARTGTPYGYVKLGTYRGVIMYPFPDDVAVTVSAYCKVDAQSLAVLGTPLIPQGFHMGLVYAAVGETLANTRDDRDLPGAQRNLARAAGILKPYRALAARKHDASPVSVRGRKF